ncbi:MAG TPA: hypothetical protein VJK51_02970 [Candidatus Nanoarchaeia archaeon]|nr:hypothetical protein [Candidatus Nanoarchaeia archaeon]
MGWRENKNIKISVLIIGLIIFLGIGLFLHRDSSFRFRTIVSYITIFLIVATILSFTFRVDKEINKSIYPLHIIRFSLVLLTLTFIPYIQFLIYLIFYPASFIVGLIIGEDTLRSLFSHGDFDSYPRTIIGLIVLTCFTLIYSGIILWIYRKIKQKKVE